MSRTVPQVTKCVHVSVQGCPSKNTFSLLCCLMERYGSPKALACLEHIRKHCSKEWPSNLKLKSLEEAAKGNYICNHLQKAPKTLFPPLPGLSQHWGCLRSLLSLSQRLRSLQTQAAPLSCPLLPLGSQFRQLPCCPCFGVMCSLVGVHTCALHMCIYALHECA